MDNEEKEIVEEKENVVEEVAFPKKKRNKGYIIVIVLLILVILGMAGYFCYDKGIIFNKKQDTEVGDKKDSEKEKKDEVRELTATELESFKERIDVINFNFDMIFPIEDATKLSNQQLLWFAFMNRKTDDYSKPFTSDDLANVVKKYFGNNIELKYEDIKCAVCGENYYTYDSSNNTYKYYENHPGHGGPGSVVAYYYYVSSEVTNEKTVVINSHILYGIYRGDTWGPQNAYYRSVKDTRGGQPILGDKMSDNELTLTDEMYNSVKDKLPITTYTFEKDENDFYNLISVTISE